MRRVVVTVPLGLLLSATLLAQGPPVLTIPSNVTVDGIPPIPMSLVEAVAPYGQYRAARFAAWHPIERRVVITTRFANATQFHYVKVPGGARTQLTFYQDGVTEVINQPIGAAFTPNGDALVFERDTAGGKEATQLFRYDLETGVAMVVTDGKSRNGIPVMSRGGLLAYTSNRRDGKNFDVYVVDPAKPASTRVLLQDKGRWEPLDWSADDRAILVLQNISASERYLWRLDVGDGRKTLLTPKSERPARWAAAQFSSDGQIYALSDFNGEISRVWRFSQARWTAVTPADQPIDSFALSPDGRTIAAVIDLGSSMRLQLMDLNGRPKPTPSLPPGVVQDVRWHPTGSDVGFSHASGRAFNDVYSINVARQRVERWTYSEIGGVNPESLPDAEIVKWKSFDGLEISGVLYRPPARFSGPRPVIINVHGGPAFVERPRHIGRSNYFRNELGIAIIYPNIRGSLGFGRKFEELDNGRLREDAVKDIGALLDWIAAQPFLDKTRVMIAGPSYGGYIALAAAIEYGDRIRAANPAFAITDYPSYLESTDMARQANRNLEYGDPADPEMRAYLTRISPLTNAAKLKAPVYIAAGAKDIRVPISQAEAMVKALKANGTPVWYLRLEDAGHQQLTTSTLDLTVYVWVLFMQKYLLN